MSLAGVLIVTRLMRRRATPEFLLNLLILVGLVVTDGLPEKCSGRNTTIVAILKKKKKGGDLGKSIIIKQWSMHNGYWFLVFRSSQYEAA
jgi:hypothetical protein